MDLRPSPECEAFIRGWEKCYLTPYKDVAGKWTVGYGHLMQPTDPIEPITQDEADSLFHFDLQYTADGVEKLIPAQLTQCQFDALCAFSFNVGLGALATSTLRKRINGGYMDEAADQLLVWDKYRDSSGAYLVSSGLAKRRAAERAIFVACDYSGRP